MTEQVKGELVKTELVKTDIDEWVAEVAAHLDGLPARERDRLLADLRDHVAEVAAEGGTLDDAEAYAAELLATADVRPAVARRRWSAVPMWLVVTAAVVVVVVLLLGVVSVGHTQPVPRPSSSTNVSGAG